MIGTPFAASAVMAVPGHERWHHDPEFYYRAGGGPLLDMGPYYVPALVHLLGPVTSVTGVTSPLDLLDGLRTEDVQAAAEATRRLGGNGLSVGG